MWGISYWIFPLISGCVWLGMLIAMLVVWNVEGKPHYASMEDSQTIAYISDIGAEGLKPLFIAGSIITTVFLNLSFVSERWLRHRGRLVKNTTITEILLSGFSMLFALIGAVGLILLSIFDTLRHPKLHDVFLVLFIGGYILSAICICWEYQRLGIHYRQHKILRGSFWAKLFFIITDVTLAIAFGVCNAKKVTNAAAVLEWAVAFIFTFYVFSFFIDLLPAIYTKHFTGDQTAIESELNGSPSNARRGERGHKTGRAINGFPNSEYVQNGYDGRPTRY